MISQWLLNFSHLQTGKVHQIFLVLVRTWLSDQNREHDHSLCKNGARYINRTQSTRENGHLTPVRRGNFPFNLLKHCGSNETRSRKDVENLAYSSRLLKESAITAASIYPWQQSTDARQAKTKAFHRKAAPLEVLWNKKHSADCPCPAQALRPSCPSNGPRLCQSQRSRRHNRYLLFER